MTVRKIKSIGDVPYPIDDVSDAFSPLLTAGAALGITGEATDSAAWLQRVSTSDGPTTVRSIHGRTLRWNQLYRALTFNFSGTSYDIVADGTGKWTVTINEGGTSGDNSNISAAALPSSTFTEGHKYLITTNNASITLFLKAYNTRTNTIFTASAAQFNNAALSFTNLAAGTYVLYPQLFDLTAMFGAGSEPSTIEEFTALYPEPYYPYDAGSLLPVNMTGVETTGFNQWDEEWELGAIAVATGQNSASNNIIRSKNYDRCFPDTSYYIHGSQGFYVFWYDAEKNYISNTYTVDTIKTSPANAAYFRIRVDNTTTYNHDICINLSDPTRNGEYEPYWHQERTIPAGILRGAGSVFDELTGTERITRIGERAYQSGDESDANVVTDGTATHYPLATPTTTPIDPPLNLTYRTAAGGTERVMVSTGEQSAPPIIVAAQGYTAESLRDAALSAIAPVENGLASTNYGVGAYLVHGGQLCKVTTAIATGEAISIGTNVTATTVMAEVIALIAQ